MQYQQRSDGLAQAQPMFDYALAMVLQLFFSFLAFGGV
jgi:hypothetical protein